jgi:hypothetical protein
MNQQATISKTTTRQKLTAAEQEIIDYLEKDRGRPLTEQEINLSLEQARMIGHL